ncbi:MAG: Maf family protein, partial [Pseudomonadota bacterium]
MKLILASSSPYRRALLARLKIPFEAILPDVDETPQPNETPEKLVERLSREKARKVATAHP